jgi:hypothetical protein
MFHADGRTRGHEEVNSHFHKFVNAPKNEFFKNSNHS